ncbi:hypothetical protein Afe04nite_52190 [Asanoa ferruginea]|nr:hypothetical protein Afe04nite_52190 [Asanoa ferruginea]
MDGVAAVSEGPQHRATHDVVVFDQKDGGHVKNLLPLASQRAATLSVIRGAAPEKPDLHRLMRT